MKNLRIIPAVIAFLLLFSSGVSAITKKEAIQVLKRFVPSKMKLVVHSVKESPVKGLWEVVVEIEGKKNIVYMDKERRYIILGSIIDISKSQNITQERLQDLNRVDLSQIPLDDAIVYGPRDAKKYVIVFEDPD